MDRQPPKAAVNILDIMYPLSDGAPVREDGYDLILLRGHFAGRDVFRMAELTPQRTKDEWPGMTDWRWTDNRWMDVPFKEWEAWLPLRNVE